MNVLSLFDGMSCGRIALERAGIEVENYYSSEIDKYGIQVANKNYPQDANKRLGDVTKWREWQLPNIDIVIAGSPCQGFSFAGKQLNFNDPRSKLFFEFVDICNKFKPKYILLENVEMKKEFRDIIDKSLGMKATAINSSSFAAQSRPRLYWTNITISPIKDKGVVIRDILSTGVDESLFIAPSKTGNRVNKKNYVQYDINGKGHGSQDQRAYYLDGKHGCLDTGCNGKSKVLTDEGLIRKTTIHEKERLQTVPINYTSIVSEAQASKMLGNGWTVDVIAHIFKGLK